MCHNIGDKSESAYQDQCTMTKLWEKAINEFRIKTSIVLKFHQKILLQDIKSTWQCVVCQFCSTNLPSSPQLFGTTLVVRKLECSGIIMSQIGIGAEPVFIIFQVFYKEEDTMFLCSFYLYMLDVHKCIQAAITVCTPSFLSKLPGC